MTAAGGGRLAFVSTKVARRAWSARESRLVALAHSAHCYGFVFVPLVCPDLAAEGAHDAPAGARPAVPLGRYARPHEGGGSRAHYGKIQKSGVFPPERADGCFPEEDGDHIHRRPRCAIRRYLYLFPHFQSLLLMRADGRSLTAPSAPSLPAQAFGRGSACTQRSTDVEWHGRLLRDDGAAAKTAGDAVELGHGSNVAGLETTATFDEAADQFIIHTPRVEATKWWIGGAAQSATHSCVFARLIVRGVDYGVKSFIVQLRDRRDFSLLPGINIGDIGKKMGRDGIDNGCEKTAHDQPLVSRSVARRDSERAAASTADVRGAHSWASIDGGRLGEHGEESRHNCHQIRGRAKAGRKRSDRNKTAGLPYSPVQADAAPRAGI
ncbi:MAG: hypothetical protein BJ554DRAFT_2259, partial [Olpidium bornovanus]